MRNFWIQATKLPGGGWLSSAPDMARFEVAILTDRLIKRAARDIMWTPQMPSDGLGRMVYGLGWRGGTRKGVQDVGHGGSQQGTSAKILIAQDARAGKTFDSQITFVTADNGRARELILHEGGIDLHANRIQIIPHPHSTRFQRVLMFGVLSREITY
jgi:CubicO group peptidase (beta-lactamase class C family)